MPQGECWLFAEREGAAKGPAATTRERPSVVALQVRRAVAPACWANLKKRVIIY